MIYIAVMLIVTTLVCAEKQNLGSNNFIEGIISSNAVQSTPNSFVELDFSVVDGESWDAKDQPNNIVTNCINGDTITGFETSNIIIETVGRSYFSEAIIYFSDSNQGDDNSIKFRVGAGNHSSGSMSFSTSSILDITDTGNVDVVSLSDSKFYIQLYEETDDSPNTIDARYISGSLKVWGVNLEMTANCPYVAAAIEADLALEYTSNANDILPTNEIINFDITINNLSNILATNVVLENIISENLQFTSLTCSDDVNIVVTEEAHSISLGEIAANTSIQCAMKAHARGFGEIINSVNIISDNDPDISNNSITLIVRGSPQSVPVNNLYALIILLLLIITSFIYTPLMTKVKS